MAAYDRAFVTMVREHVDVITRMGIDPMELESWDDPRPTRPLRRTSQHEAWHEVCHAIGFIAGCAAGLDMTPLEFLDSLP